MEPLIAPRINEVLARLRARFLKAGIDGGALEARILLAGLLYLEPATIFVKGNDILSADELERIEDAAQRRLRGEPVHRILGHREFYAMDLLLSPDTLEPRPDTETLVDVMLRYAHQCAAQKGHVKVLDLGTGTGALALALLSNVPSAIAVVTDISPGALVTATENARRLGVADRFRSFQSNWFEGVTGLFDVVVSNPPYIPTAVVGRLDREVREHDPTLALDGGLDGLDAYRSIAAECSRFLSEGGHIGVEIGYDQKHAVTDIFLTSGLTFCQSEKDLSGNDRVLVFAGNR